MTPLEEKSLPCPTQSPLPGRTAARGWILLPLVSIALSWPLPSAAQDAPARPERFAAAATAIDAQTLLTERFTIHLFGIEAVDSAQVPLKVQARTLLDDRIGGGAVRCNVLGWENEAPLAQCTASNQDDLAIVMLREGFAVADRAMLRGSVYEKPYFAAETEARKESRGIWLSADKESGRREETLAYALAIVCLIAPLAGFALVALAGSRGLARISNQLDRQFRILISRENDLREREKFVVASMFEAELSANRTKLEAFLVVYDEILKSLRDSAREHTFRQTGEMIHEQPALARAAFDANKDKMELLGAKIAGEMTSLYAAINPDPEYITLEPGSPIDQAVRKVEQVIQDAQALIEPLEHLLAAVTVIVRDKGRSALSARKTDYSGPDRRSARRKDSAQV
ncbi:MAG: thermonuclease family protein [Rhodospirillales bacterium]|nr:thermonuclease family protein [Rhodospirillales bacterium]